jgi:hypothetical protein
MDEWDVHLVEGGPISEDWGMRAILIVLACVALSAAAAAAVIRTGGPDTVQLDSDISALRAQIAEANTEASKYSSGVILVETQIRIAILKNTVAMLEQKKVSFLRGLTIIYHDSIIRASVQDPDIESGLNSAKNEAREARLEAAQYTGGLIQAMAFMREATAKLTQASIEQRLELARAGIPLPVPNDPAKTMPPSPGKSAADKDAL